MALLEPHPLPSPTLTTTELVSFSIILPFHSWLSYHTFRPHVTAVGCLAASHPLVVSLRSGLPFLLSHIVPIFALKWHSDFF